MAAMLAFAQTAGAALPAPLPAAAAAAGAAPAAADAGPIRLPSGAEARLQDVIDDVPGPAGVTWRYRFVMPSLATMVPSTTGEASEELTPEDMAELDRLGTEIEGGDPSGGLDESELVSPEELDLPMAVPADPDILLQDPVHDDIVWLCEHWVLPRLPAGEAPPGQIIISLADRPTVFGAFDLEAVQLFEAFSVAPDGKRCVWEPW